MDISEVRILTKEVEDPYVKENFKVLDRYLKTEVILNTGFQHLELTFSENKTFELNHTLNSIPKDIIQTSIKGSGAITYNYNNFTTTTFEVTITGTTTLNPLIVRLFLGSYRGNING